MSLLLLLAILALTPEATAPGADAPSGQDEIVVTAPCALAARQLRPALGVFRRGRATRAPDSVLFFETDPAARRDGATVAALRFRAGARAARVAADAQGRFVLPASLPDDWQVTGPCHDGVLAISPLVMSPGTNEADRRLGDLRLQCDVGWEIAKQAIAAAAGAFTRVTGECKSSLGAIHAAGARPIDAAAVIAGAATRPVRVSADGLRYSVPLGDKRLPDAARVRFRFR